MKLGTIAPWTLDGQTLTVYRYSHTKRLILRETQLGCQRDIRHVAFIHALANQSTHCTDRLLRTYVRVLFLDSICDRSFFDEEAMTKSGTKIDIDSTGTCGLD